MIHLNSPSACPPKPAAPTGNGVWVSLKPHHSHAVDKKRTKLTFFLSNTVSLIKMGEKAPEDLTDGEIFYDLDRFPKIGMSAERDSRSSGHGYLTMVSIR